MKEKALVLQGGGPTRVINATLVGIARQAKAKGLELIGVRRGIDGILSAHPDLVHFSDISEKRLEIISKTSGAALGTTRTKPTQKDCEKIVEFLIAQNIKYLFYIGGNDTALAVKLMDEYAKSKGAELVFMHVIKTVDNDVPMNDHNPGFGSAARYVASVVRGAALDNLSLPGIYIAVTMGRNAGFLAGASVLARSKVIPELGPHVICMPEREFNEADFLAHVKKIYDKLGRAIIVVSEGIWIMTDGKKMELAKLLKENAKINESNKADGFSHTQLSGNGAIADYLSGLISAKLGIKRVRGDTLGYAQRSFEGSVSQVDWKEAYKIGEDAVTYAIDGKKSVSVTLQATRGSSYKFSTSTCDLSQVADKVRTLPPEFISKDGYDVTPAFVEYVAPLIGEPLPEVDTLLDSRNKYKSLLGCVIMEKRPNILLERVIKKMTVPHCQLGAVGGCEECKKRDKEPEKYYLISPASDPTVCRPMADFGFGLWPYEVLKVFSSEKEAKDYANKNKIRVCFS